MSELTNRRPWGVYLWPAVLLVTAAAFPGQSQILNKNLVVNGDAEAGSSQPNASDPKVASIPSWTTTGGFSVGTYGGGDFVQPDDFGPVDRGQHFFFAGQGNQESTAVQTVDLTGAAADIDAGRVKFYLSGYIGLSLGLSDNIGQTSLKAEFQDASGKVLFTSTAPGPLQSDLNSPELLLLRQATGFLPPNVRKAKITIDLANPEAAGNSFAADNISLVLSAEPMFGVNLLTNGDGETDAHLPANDPDSEDLVPVPGWNAHHNFAIARYDGPWTPQKTDNVPTSNNNFAGGNFLFDCFTERSTCPAWQSIDFSTASKLVDAGKVTWSLSAWLGGYTDAMDDADLAVTFYNGSGGTISTATIGPVTEANRSGLIGLWPVSTDGTVPSGARSARVTLTFHKLSPPTDNLNAYADNLVFQLDSIQITSVTNAASFQSGPVAPGEFVTISGQSLGPATGVVASGSQKGLAGTTVTFNGIEAYLTYTSATQVNAIVPYGIGNNASVVVSYKGRTSDPFALATTDSAPGIFTHQYGPGQIWAINPDSSFNSGSNAAARGSWVAFWATGQGMVSPAGVDGELIANPKSVNLPVKVTIGGIAANLVAPPVLIYTGEIQVAVYIPADAPTGNVPLVLTIGSASSRSDATIAIK